MNTDKNGYIFVALLLVILSVCCFHGKTGQREAVVEQNTKEFAVQASGLSGRHHSDMECGYSCNPFSAQMLYRICSRTSLSNPISHTLSVLQLHLFSLLKNYQAVVLPKYCFTNFISSRCPSCRYYVFALRKIII